MKSSLVRSNAIAWSTATRTGGLVSAILQFAPSVQTAPTAIQPPVTLDERRAAVQIEADIIAKAKRDQITANISPAEMSSWPIKRADAIAYQSSNNDLTAPSLALEAEARGVPLAELVEKVLAKAARLAALEALIAGRCGAIQDAASASETQAELDAIDVNAGWPV